MRQEKLTNNDLDIRTGPAEPETIDVSFEAPENQVEFILADAKRRGLSPQDSLRRIIRLTEFIDTTIAEGGTFLYQERPGLLDRLFGISGTLRYIEIR